MDLSKFFRATFLKVDDVKASGPTVVKIVGHLSAPAGAAPRAAAGSCDQ
jgi:hypothetical protein